MPLCIYIVVQALHLNGQLLFSFLDHTETALDTGIAGSLCGGTLADQGAVIADRLLRIFLQIHLIDPSQISLRDRSKLRGSIRRPSGQST